MGLTSYFFHRAVRRWCIDIRLHREIEKELKRLNAELTDPNGNSLTRRLGDMAVALYTPDYVQLTDRLTQEHARRAHKKGSPCHR